MKTLKQQLCESLFSKNINPEISDFIYNFTICVNGENPEKRKENLNNFIESKYFKEFLLDIFYIDLYKDSKDYSIDLSGKLDDESALIIKINSANGMEFILNIIYVTDENKVIITLGKRYESTNQYSRNLKRLGFKEIKSNNLTSYELKYKVSK